MITAKEAFESLKRLEDNSNWKNQLELKQSGKPYNGVLLMTEFVSAIENERPVDPQILKHFYECFQSIAKAYSSRKAAEIEWPQEFGFPKRGRGGPKKMFNERLTEYAIASLFEAEKAKGRGYNDILNEFMETFRLSKEKLESILGNKKLP